MNRKFLNTLLSIPTAPYREFLVRDYLTRVLSENRVPWFLDPPGNLVVGASSIKDYQAKLARRSKEPVRTFIAHLDHPGFHGVSWTTGRAESRLKVKWFGGSPTKRLNGASVWVCGPLGKVIKGTMKNSRLLKSGAAMTEGEITFRADDKKKISDPPEALFGGFGFRKPVWSEGGIIYTKAADDLVGAATVASLAIKYAHDGNFLGLLTRAEEVGFVGAIAHAELGWWKNRQRDLVWVSLETSRTLPNALIGKGPVVRLGDRASVFHSAHTELLSQLARKILPKGHQRRIMDGGTCEATVAVTYGIPALGISVPLGNYHNQCFEGGPDSRGKLGPAPEFVHYKDVERMFQLCSGLMETDLPWSDPFAARMGDFKKRLADSQTLLTQTF